MSPSRRVCLARIDGLPSPLFPSTRVRALDEFSAPSPLTGTGPSSLHPGPIETATRRCGIHWATPSGARRASASCCLPRHDHAPSPPMLATVSSACMVSDMKKPGGARQERPCMCSARAARAVHVPHMQGRSHRPVAAFVCGTGASWGLLQLALSSSAGTT